MLAFSSGLIGTCPSFVGVVGAEHHVATSVENLALVGRNDILSKDGRLPRIVQTVVVWREGIGDIDIQVGVHFDGLRKHICASIFIDHEQLGIVKAWHLIFKGWFILAGALSVAKRPNVLNLTFRGVFEFHHRIHVFDQCVWEHQEASRGRGARFEGFHIFGVHSARQIMQPNGVCVRHSEFCIVITWELDVQGQG